MAVGQVFWLPSWLVAFMPGKKDRFCLVVAVEQTASAVITHLLPGSTSESATRTVFRVAAGECNLPRDTYFKFRFPGQLPSTVLTTQARLQGSLVPSRVDDLKVAVMASNLVVVKRLWSS
jgi:hypothetical protein